MGEVLSQNEIDSLLKALSSGELDADEIKDKDEKQVKNYISYACKNCNFQSYLRLTCGCKKALKHNLKHKGC